ncbi:efflux RND transporter periplasmic adaptor subunit [Paracoccus benzoatiresistens]|uniref:Efflux RND transporter periplasmic adaptor subunit n=1 Tax=Paracoccus benzoatiresistens TaxID=2997341 RepID=A0ABT4JBQ4_9RHOB|nr:efflux RND transporter periplasmic adaptor subunit [Paracoccus sp. EF6]MCZ0964495.1 efflux RND transporter periplasmic adaptor subunit [Paracoccus sp. EF6]
MAVLFGLAAAGAVAAVMLRPPVVAVAAVERGQAAEIVYATGVVEPRSWAKVAPSVRERIVWMCDCEGWQVKPLDELARLDDRQARATLEELRAQQDFTTRILARLRVLAERNIASRQDLERSESEAARIAAQIAAQEVRLEAYVLRAPIAGVVLRQDGEVGEIADPATPLYHVGQPRPLHIRAEVNEEDVPRLATGQQVLIRSDAFPGRKLEAVVESITPMGDPVARTYRVHVALPDETPLMIGMTVEVNVITRLRADTLLVPAQAVGPDATVWLLEGDHARRAAVKTGICGSSKAEILEGLAQGQTVIVPAPVDLEDGARVRVRDPR